MPEEKGELDAEIAGQKVSLKNVSINTMVGGATLTLCALIAYALYAHTEESKQASAVFVSALKEQTVAIREQTSVAREQNCIMRFDQKDRQANAEFCKQIAR